MKIAFLNCLYLPQELGGAERAVRIIAEEHVKQGGESIVITLSPEGRYEQKIINGVKVYYIPLFNIGFLHGKKTLPPLMRKLWHLIDAYNPVMGFRVAKILKRERPDVMEANNLQGLSVASLTASSLLKIPVVQMIHDYYLGCANSSMYANGRVCRKQCKQCHILGTPKRMTSRIPSAIISVSNRTYDLLKGVGLFPHIAKPYIQPTAIYLEDFAKPQIKKARAGGAPLVIGYLGRLTKIKGIELLLSAVAKISGGQVRLLIGGTGDADYVEELKKTYPQNHIVFLGRVIPEEFFEKIDILFAPSIWEDPYPRVMFEAYASGVAIAVSRMGGMPEAIIDGKTGIVFESTIDGVTGAIEEIISQNFPSDSDIAACYEAAKSYDAQEIYKRQKSVWQSVLKNKN